MEYLEMGDLDGLVSLYEPKAHVVAAPGLLLVGTVAIRQVLQQLIDSGARVRLELRNIRRVDDLALVSNIATLTETTPEANRSSPPPPRSCAVNRTAAGFTSSMTRSSADGPELVHIPRRRVGDLATVVALEGEIHCATAGSELTTTQGTSDDRRCPSCADPEGRGRGGPDQVRVSVEACGICHSNHKNISSQGATVSAGVETISLGTTS
jgi:hypothetical protein